MSRLRMFSIAVLIDGALALGGAPPAAADQVPVSIRDFAYNPGVVQVTIGDTVIWSNDEASMPHDVVSGVPGAANEGHDFQSPLLRAGDTYFLTVDQPGHFQYFCSLHPYMVAQLIVESPAEGRSPTAAFTISRESGGGRIPRSDPISVP